MSKKTRTKVRDMSDRTQAPEGPSTSSSVLSRMFWKMVADFGYSTFHRWEKLMMQYINDARNCIPRNRNAQSSARGNLQKELVKPEMTWKVFCKGMRFLGITSFEFKIIAHHSNGKETVHSHRVNLGTPVELPPIENPNATRPTSSTVTNSGEV